MKLLKKQIDFSRGELNPLLTERTDLGIMEHSAKYVKNFYPTIFGTLKNRGGTRKIELLQDIGGTVENPSIASAIGGDNNFYGDVPFRSDIVGNGEVLFTITAQDEQNKIRSFTIRNIHLEEPTKLAIEYTTELVTPPAPTPLYAVASVMLEEGGTAIIEENASASHSGDSTPPPSPLPQGAGEEAGASGEGGGEEGGGLDDVEESPPSALRASSPQEGEGLAPTIVFAIEDMDETVEELPTAQCILDEEGNITAIELTNGGKVLDVAKLSASIVGDSTRVVNFTTVLLEQPTPSPYHRIVAVNVLEGGTNYSEAPAIVFSVEEGEDSTPPPSPLPQGAGEEDGGLDEGGAGEGFELPVVAATLDDRGSVASVAVVDGGKIYDLEKLSYSIEGNNEYNEAVAVQISSDGKSWRNKNSFSLTSEAKDVFVELDSYYQYIRLVKAADDYWNTSVMLDKFSFTVPAPEISTNVGGNVEDLLKVTGNFKTDYLNNVSGELLRFTFESDVNVFNLMNVKLQDAIPPKFSVNSYYFNSRPTGTTIAGSVYRRQTTTYIDSITIEDGGAGFKPNTTYNLVFSPAVGPFGVIPQAKATTNEEGVFKKVTIINNAYYNLVGPISNSINPPALFAKPDYQVSVYDSEYFDMELELQGRKLDDDEWHSFNSYRINKIKPQTMVASVAGDSFREFRIVKNNNDSIKIRLEIGSFLASVNLSMPAESIQLIPFRYMDCHYIIAICDGYIEIFRDSKLLNILKCSKLVKAIVGGIRYSQYDNRIILVHGDMVPQEIKIDKETGIWTVGDFYLANIPYATFDGETTEVAAGYITLTPSAAEGTITLTSSHDFFTEAMVNQYIDGNSVAGGRARIIKIVNAKTAIAEVIIPFYNANAFNNFWLITGYEKVWSEKRGWPCTCLFYQNRLWIGGSKGKPFSIWASRVNNFNDFNNIYNNDNEAIAIDILSKEYEEIKYIIANRGIQIFTDVAEYIAQDDSLTPNGIIISKVSSVGIDASIPPITMLGDTLFIDKNRKGLNRLAASATGDAIPYISTSVISILNSNLIKNPIAISLDYSNIDGDGNFLYIVNDDGSVTIGNILLEETITSFTRFEFNDARVQDVVLSNNNIYLVMWRSGLLYLELLDKNLYSDFTIRNNIIKDDENKQIIVDGLQDYEGGDVMIYNDSLDFNIRYRVAEGRVAISYDYLNREPATIPEIINVGFAIDCELKSNDVVINGETNTRRKRIAVADITTTNDSKGFSFNDFYLEKPTLTLGEDYVFRKHGAGNWDYKVFFKMASDFGKLEIKSVTLTINY